MMSNEFKLGLKCDVSKEQLEDRLNNNPDIIELHLNEDDLFGSKKSRLVEVIKRIQEKNIKVYLHHPMKLEGRYLHMNENDNKHADYLSLSTRILIGLCEEYDIKCVIHINYGMGDINDSTLKEDVFSDKDTLIKTVAKTVEFVNKFGNELILIENGCSGVGAYRKDLELARLFSGTSIRLCLDFSHLAISLNCEKEEINDYILKTLEILKNNVDYFHVVDSEGVIGVHDSLTLGKGIIDWELLKSIIKEKDYIYEIGLEDFSDCKEMKVSHDYLKNL